MQKLHIRQQNVLRATVHHYVDTMVPVGSDTLVRRFRFNASSSTVRTEMGVLENRGFLLQPHASAGRVPSAQGYRHYVDCLLPEPGVVAKQLDKELTSISLRFAALDDLLWHLAKRLTDFTGLMSLITKPVRPISTLQQIRLVKSGDRLLVMLVESSNIATHLNIRCPPQVEIELPAIEHWLRDQLNHSSYGELNWTSLPPQLISSGSLLKEAIESHRQSISNLSGSALFHGMSRLLRQPEFCQSETFRPLLELMDNQPESIVPLTQNNLDGVWIGAEHPNKALKDCSVITAPYKNSSAGIGHVALIGPMRMAYSTAIAAVRSVASHLNRVLS